MATIRPMRGKWQVLIRRKFHKHLTKSFVLKSDAQKYARETEAQIDKSFLVSYEEAQKTKFSFCFPNLSLPVSLSKIFNALDRPRQKLIFL